MTTPDFVPEGLDRAVTIRRADDGTWLFSTEAATEVEAIFPALAGRGREVDR